MGKPGKRFKNAIEGLDRDKAYGLEEAVGLLKSMPATKFDQSVDIAINLGVDPRHADQMVRGALVLPHGIGKDTRVLVFCQGRQGEGGPGSWRRLRGRRRARQEDPGRGLDGLRTRDRDARHDGRGGSPR